jgi:mRNA-degrading endonuclease toxin of MazEF toxin-antitoxin module
MAIVLPSRIWEVVRVDFPHADTQAVAGRPALVIASPPANDTFGIVWVLMITSSRHAAWPDDVAITDLAKAGLSRPSVIRTAKIAAIDSRQATILGDLGEADRVQVAACLKRHLHAALRV